MFTYRNKITLFIFIGLFSAFVGFAIYKLITEHINRKIKASTVIAVQTPAISNPTNPRIDEILSLISKSYVDSINTSSLKKSSIEDILNGLDPHSDYLSPQDVKALNLNLGGSFGGIGVEYYILNDTLLITNVTPNGPAAKAGIQAGDKILSVGNFKISGQGLPKDQMTGKIKGKDGTMVNLSLLTNNKNITTVNIKRKNIAISSIESSYLIKDNVGYIKVSNFGENTDLDFVNAVNKLKKSGMRKLILDLRDNGGGFFDAGVALADQFLSENKLIVYIKGAHTPRSDYISSGEGAFQNGELVVLIDENTASASEIVAGAIKDLNRGTIIGRRSFGKGLVQEKFEFKDGAALNLTVARYYTPSGKSIQKPYKIGDKADYDSDIDNRLESGELTNSDSTVNSADGGITPDVFVKLDKDGLNPFYAKVVNSNIISSFVYDVLVKKYNRNKIRNIYKFEIPDEDYLQFLNYAKQKGVVPAKPAFINTSKDLVKSDLSELLTRFYYGENGYYINSNERDSSIKKALSVLGERN